MTTLAAPWQEYDCPTQKADTDLEGAQMVHQGQAFYCHWCGANHVAGVDVAITTHDATGQDIDLPANTEELAALREGRPYQPHYRSPTMPQSQSQASTATALTIGTHYPAHGGTLGAILCTTAGEVYGLIVSDEEHEITAGAWGERSLDVPGANSSRDGAANTAAMAAAHSPIATAVQALAIAGHSDWYIPSRIEAIALFEGVRDLFDHGDWYWTSTQYSRYYAWIQDFEGGHSGASHKGNEFRARAVRMIQLQPFTPSPLVAAGDSTQIFAPGEQQAVAEAVA